MQPPLTILHYTVHIPSPQSVQSVMNVQLIHSVLLTCLCPITGENASNISASFKNINT